MMLHSKPYDRSEEISHVRNILRKSFVAGEQLPDVNWALARLKEIAEEEGDMDMVFEQRRWSMSMTFCKPTF